MCLCDAMRGGVEKSEKYTFNQFCIQFLIFLFSYYFLVFRVAKVVMLDMRETTHLRR